METFKAGFDREIITPQLGVRLGGYGIPERPAESVHDNLYSSALVMEQGKKRCAIVSLDWLYINSETTERIKQATCEKAGIPEDSIIICTIHSHTTPNTVLAAGWGDIEQAYIDSVMPVIIESIVKASQKLAPAKLGVGVIKSQVGVNRRLQREDGSVCFAGNEKGSYDPDMTVLRFVDMQNAPIVTMVHYGAHCTAWGPERVVSRDWPGVMLDRLEKQTNSPTMFVNSANGDVGPRTNVSAWSGSGYFSAGTGDGLESVLEVGYRGATDAIQCYFSINSFDEALILKSTNADIVAPVRPLPLPDKVREKLDELEPFKNEWGSRKCLYAYYQRILKAHDEPKKESNIIESRIIAVGPVAFMSLPGEAFSSIALRLRAGSPFKYTLLLTNANGYIAYIPDLESRKIGGYEVNMESALLTYIPVENVDEFIVNSGIKSLKTIHNSK